MLVPREAKMNYFRLQGSQPNGENRHVHRKISEYYLRRTLWCRYTQLYTKDINNDLPYGTWKYIQYPVIT